jgi:uncharacterized protein (TIGR03435 family)
VRALLGILLCSAAFGQAFEVASVKTAPPGFAAPMETGPETFHMANTLFYLVEWAYGLQDYQLSGGPDWWKKDRFEIQAKSATPATESQMKQMLQRLLADRFVLKVHREIKEIPIYALVVDKKGPKLTAAKDATQCNGNGCFGVSNGALTASGGTMAFTAQVLTRLLDRPALDKTNLTGHYDFKLTYDQSSVKPPIVGMPITPTDGPSIFAAVEDLGLKLEPQKFPVETLIIDSVERPSEN